MNTHKITNLFSHSFLSQFIYAKNILPFTDKEIINLDKELSKYEQFFTDPDIENYLISKNELLASFAISKAENSTLTLREADEIYKLISNNRDYEFIHKKLKTKQKLTQKDHDKLEFFNIAKTFRLLNQKPLSINKLTPDLIKEIHKNVSGCLDIFKNHLVDFTVYKSGKWRDNDQIRVGSYIPAPYKDIEKGVKELINWLKKNKSVTAIAIFHTALYGLHPFNNGNKRVCRILEHILLRDVGINSKNLYSTSYYYHKEKPRYYKYLLASLERKNLNYFTSFVLESIVLSIISTLKTGIEINRKDYLEKNASDYIKSILNPLIKRKEIQFKYLYKFSKNKISKQTFVNKLKIAEEEKIITRRVDGKKTYYRLNISSDQEKTIQKWLSFTQKRLSYIPDEIKLI